MVETGFDSKPCYPSTFLNKQFPIYFRTLQYRVLPGEKLAQVFPCLGIPIVKHVVVHTCCVRVRPWRHQTDKAAEGPELTCSYCLSPENRALCSSEGTSGQPSHVAGEMELDFGMGNTRGSPGLPCAAMNVTNQLSSPHALLLP